MHELSRPFIRAWEYAGNVGGYPGQAFFVVVAVMAFILVMTWISNRR